jgi:formylglycine-generating enzyme
VANRGPFPPEGDNAAPPSCALGGPGMTSCDPGDDSADTCCTSLEVEGGIFQTNAGGAGNGTLPATVSDFRLDKYLVTVARFRQFVVAWNGGAGYVPPAGSGKHTHVNDGAGLVNSGEPPTTYETGWLPSDDRNLAPTDANLICDPTASTWTSSAGSHESLPITCVNWWESYAFCIWDGGRDSAFLPSDSEWEYAAAGGSQQRAYPWGTMDPGTLSEYAIYNCYYDARAGCGGVSNVAPVGTPTLGAGRWGQLDMGGEVLEWELDWWSPDREVYECTDCAYLTTATPNEAERMFRGGSWNESGAALSPSHFGFNEPSARTPFLGFRCARTP